MDSPINLYLLGDQTCDVSDKLRQLLSVTGNTGLNTFFEGSHDALRNEIGRLHLEPGELVPPFANIAELLSAQHQGPIHPAFQTALICIYQLGEFISQHSHSKRVYPSSGNTFLLGLCTGGLPAAAISCARSVAELLPLAIHTVGVSFRLVFYAAEMRDRIEPRAGNASWSMLVVDLPPEEARSALQSFSVVNQLHAASKPYIAAYSRTGSTISGPPSILEKLKKASPIAGKRILSLPVFVISHAPHLFISDDVEWIMKTTSAKAWASYNSHIPLISGSTSKVFGGNFKAVLQTAVENCLRQPLRWDTIAAELPSLLLSRDPSKIRLFPLGTKADSAIQAAFQDFLNHNASSPQQSPNIEAIRFRPTQDDERKPHSRSKIAICGLAGRFPGGAGSAEAFWDLLYRGLDVASEVPANRWDIKTHVDVTGKAKNTSAVPWGCWLDDPELFDARFFGISPKEAPAMDPAQRIALMVTYEALEAAGIVPGATPSTRKDRIGVYLGVSSQDYGETNTTQQIGVHSIVGGIRPFIAGRLNYCHNLSGPSYVVDTACSSSLAAIQLACNALWMGDVDTAVAGGTNVITNPDGHAGLDRGFFLSRTGNCKTFDKGADGYCRGEGVGIVLLKRLDDALEDGDPIQAVILDIKTNHSAESDSITRPHSPTQIKLFQKVLCGSGTSPNEISYIEMHGTGTQHGDAAEMTSCLATFAPSANHQARDEPLYIGAAKANIGHGEAASGISSVAKVVLMMKHNIIPPHCGIKTEINPNFPLDMKERNVHIAFKPTPWSRGVERPRKVLLNNFSAPGGNTAMVLEDAPLVPAPTEQVQQTSHIITVTAKCGESLIKNMKSLLKYINDRISSGLEPSFLASLSYTTTARRQHWAHRACVTGSSAAEIRDNLHLALQNKQGFARPIALPKVVFAFTGQGSQYAGMGQALMCFSRFSEHIKRLNHLAMVCGYPAFDQVLKNPHPGIETYEPIVIQLAIVSLEIALAHLWISWGIVPAAVVGHSLGEYAALNIAGVLSDADTIYLVGERAKLLRTACRAGTHVLLAVRTSAAEIQASTIGRRFNIACINGPSDVVLGGPVDQIDSLKAALTASNIKATTVKVSYAFHTSQVDPILLDFAKAAKGIEFMEPTIPVLSPLLAQTVTKQGFFGPDYLARHCREPVNIHAALVAENSNGTILNARSFVIEIGAQPLVTAMVKASIGPEVTTMASLQRGSDTWSLISTALSRFYRAGFDINWIQYQRDFKAAARVLELPAYSWDVKSYWIQYVEDWSLRKGEPLPTLEELQAQKNMKLDQPTSTESTIERSLDTEKPRLVPTINCTTVHRIVKEEFNGKTGYILVESDLSRKDLLPIVQGHWVNGIPLCTPSVYADIVLNVGKYLLDRYQPNLTDRLVDVSHMEVERALIAKGKGPQHMRASATVDWETMTASFSFFSVDTNDITTIEHSTCKAIFRNTSELNRLLPRRQEQLNLIEKLDRDVQEGKAFRLKTDVSFKMVAGLAKFHKEYRSHGEITLNGETLEATSTANFSKVKKRGIFVCHPAFIDAFTQIAGFVMNAKGTTDLDVEVYVNRGWDSFQLFKEVTYTARYRLYIKMARTEGTMYKGDVVVLDDEGITASFKGVALRGIPRKAFNMVLDNADRGVELGSPALAPTRAKSKTAQPVRVAGPLQHTASISTPVSMPTGPGSSSNISTLATTQLSPSLKTPRPSKQTSPLAAANPSDNKQSEANRKYGLALEIIFEETGLSEDEITDGTTFADMGVDSLLSMVINSRLKEELHLEMDDENNSLFIAYPTMGIFKEKLRAVSGADAVETIPNTQPTVPQVPISAAITTPQRDEDISPPQHSISPTPPMQVIENIQKKGTAVAVDVSPEATQETTDSLFQTICEIIAEETGVDVDDLTDGCALADVGIDSLLSMVVSSRLREELNLELEAAGDFFISMPTIKHIREFCNKVQPAGAFACSKEHIFTPHANMLNGPISKASTTGFDVISLSEISPSLSESESGIMPKPQGRPRSSGCRQATSVILQGFPRTAKKTLFLLPDGGGSSSSYVSLPRLDSDTAIVGLNCPYIRDAEKMKCHINELINSYVTEIRRRQPHGPYHIGGWSSGGVMAYIAVQQLVEAGEDVHTLLILDSPMPSTMDKLPPHFYDYCKSIGLFGTEDAPLYLLKHFDATVDVLDTYTVSRLAKTTRPMKLAVLWAAESVADGKENPKFPSHLPTGSVGLAFMISRRTDFGPAGWETLLPPDVEVVTGKVQANHFTMMRNPAISNVSKFIDKVMR